MQTLRLMRSASRLDTVHAQLLQARTALSAPHAAPHTIQRGTLPAARLPLIVRAAAYQAATEEPPSPVSFKPRVFADYSIYKGKGALSLKAIKPEWKETVTADIGLNRAGSMFFEFAPADQSAAQNGFGERRYEWTKKQTFALSPTEMGGFIVQDNFSMMHDPGKGRQNEGQVLKTLKVQAMPDGGVMLSLTVKDPQQPAGNFYVGIPLTPAEYGVIKSLANFIIPRALGFDQIFAAESVADSPSADMPPF